MGRSRDTPTSLSSHHVSLSFFLFPLLSILCFRPLMCYTCACWTAASACTHEGPLGFRSCAATPAAPRRMSPSSRPRSHSFCLQGRNSDMSIWLNFTATLGGPEEVNATSTLHSILFDEMISVVMVVIKK